ncbi:hypothetical protein [Methylobacter sp. BlB1]|uniref:hypothetical protein n=1 Tax=Methylobacter sp. BlB1 TaxID=2785914 RepID=UPI001895EA84|nr:hypothetical protein [Methylobacter sp. BlB1]MBF6649811.1 hypothetical protein [Methylobacter sp. BlB1]
MKIKKLGVFLAALFLTTVGQAEDRVNPVRNNQYMVKRVNDQYYFGKITIPKVMVNDKLEFVNVKLERNSDLSFSVISTEKPSVSKTATTYDPASGTATIPTVVIEGKVAYANVKLKFNPDGTLGVLSSEEPRVDDITRCSVYAAHSVIWGAHDNYCAAGRFPTCKPEQSQISKLQEGMTYDEVVETLGCHGVLLARVNSGGPTAFYVWGTGSSTSHHTTLTFSAGELRYINSSFSFYTYGPSGIEDEYFNSPGELMDD